MSPTGYVWLSLFFEEIFYLLDYTQDLWGRNNYIPVSWLWVDVSRTSLYRILEYAFGAIVSVQTRNKIKRLWEIEVQ